MARLPRKTQKIFAQNASDIAIFGSKANGTGLVTNDVETAQSLSAYTTGWDAAVLGGNTEPTLEDFNALEYIDSSQISYIMQEGICEYDAGTTYYNTSIVKKSGTFILYGSLTNENIGNPLTDIVNWKLLGDLTLINNNTGTDGSGAYTVTPNQSYLAATNGFLHVSLYGLGNGGSGVGGIVYSDSNSTPTTTVWETDVSHYDTNGANPISYTHQADVRIYAGKYFKIVALQPQYVQAPTGISGVFTPANF